jgi:hypothetical protein
VTAGFARIPLQHSVLRHGAGMTIATTQAGGRANTLVIWMVLIGLIIPAAEVQIFVGGAKFTVGRLAVVLLLVPAIFTLFQRNRRRMPSDLFISATAIWIVGAAAYVDGTKALSSAAAESLEFLGGYLVARAYFFGPAALRSFLQVLKIFLLVSVLIAVAENATGRLVVHDAFAAILNVTPVADQYRMGTVRATATFDHAILFGTFCSVAAAMLLYSESNVLKRLLWVAFCLFGVVLSLSSSSIMACAIMLATYVYGGVMKNYPWRWSACLIVFAACAVVIMVATNDPLGWILAHLTLEPQSGYFRLFEWNSAFFQISLSPWAGYAFHDFGSAELYSVDCVWLALALRFGLPTVVFLILSNITALLPTRKTVGINDPYISRMRTAFSLILVMFMFVGLTVHYWNYMWIFWGICIGIRASLREYSMTGAGRSAAYPQMVESRIAMGRF